MGGCGMINGSPLPAVLAISPDPDNILFVIQALGEEMQGRATFPTFCLTWLVPAGFLTSLTLTLPEGWYGVHRSPAVLTSDLYDPLLTAQVFADGSLVTPAPLSLTGPVEVEWGEFYRKLRSVRTDITNGTVNDARVTQWVRATFLEKSFYEEFFLPLMKYNYLQLKNIAEAMGAIRM